MKKLIASLLLLIVVTIGCGLSLLNYLFYSAQLNSFFTKSNTEVWAHRGYLETGANENSVAAIQAAKEIGALGVEIDIYYDEKLDQFIVSHDIPYHKQEDGSLLALEKVVEKFPKLKFWLDFKNLYPHNASLALRRFKNLDARWKLKQRVLLESQQGKALAEFAKSGYAAVYWILVNRNRKRYWLNEMQRRWLIATTPFAGVSMDHKQLMSEIGSSYAHLPMFTFTVNGAKLLEDVKKYNPKVILTDKNYF